MNESHMRASDADRDATIAALREAFAEGRLSQDEFDERLGRAHSARTYADLSHLTEDLPGAVAVPSPTPVVEQSSDPAKERRDLRSAWASWLGVGALVNIIWFATWMGSGPAPYYWPIWVVGPWGGAMLIWTLTSRAKRRSDG
ncbi:MAG: DUF1707 SHOCT-like domain-containing protein [Candidatus Nanopelagicales bacterium]